MKKSLWPFILFASVIFLLGRGLLLHPNEIPSPLIGKPAPSFNLPSLFDPEKNISSHHFLGQVTLFHVWATWCSACLEEHSTLLQLARQEHILLYGLDYKDNAEEAKTWLKQQGNPYQFVISDTLGNIGMDWGVYGTPESFIIHKRGIIRYKQIGPITPEIWLNTLKPLVIQLENEQT